MAKKGDTSAPHIINGWNFQVAAAIYLFLNYLKNTKEIGLEKKEDIELVLNNGKRIYAQAKSSLSADEIQTNSHIPEIKKAISTLQGTKDDIEKLIVIFNFFKPFGAGTYFDPSSSDQKAFSDLITKDKTIINNEIVAKKYKIDPKKLSFWLLRFDGEKPQEKLFDYVNRKLILRTPLNFEKVVDLWRAKLYDNGADAKRFISKDILAGIVLNEYSYDNITTDILTVLDIDWIAGDLETKYKSKISKCFKEFTFRFSLCNTVNAMYFEYRENNKALSGNKVLYEFVKNSASSVLPAFEPILHDIIDETEKQAVYKICLYIIGYKHGVINEIAEVMGIDN